MNLLIICIISESAGELTGLSLIRFTVNLAKWMADSTSQQHECLLAFVKIRTFLLMQLRRER